MSGTITAAKLKSALASVGDTLMLEANMVGNLTVRDTAGVYLGYIDFQSGLFVGVDGAKA